ncbi:MAG: outer membrane lipoprotein-sorting protein [Bacteroidota bacterium]
MKRIYYFSLLIASLLTFSASAQTADEIVSNYFENTGGLDAWNSIKALKYEGVINFGGTELPMTMIQSTDGKQMVKADVQGVSFYQAVFDGETLWGTNQITMKAEKKDAESTSNTKLDMNDMVDPLLNYKKKGYTLELIGKETIDGTETFKLKLTTEPKMYEGEELPSVTFYYFDTENFVPIITESEVQSGQAKGMITQIKMSDYQEVDGVYFPFSMTTGVKGQPGGQEITINKITVNPELDDSIFAFPEEG